MFLHMEDQHDNQKKQILEHINPTAQEALDLLIAQTILSDTTVWRSGVEWEDLKPF